MMLLLALAEAAAGQPETPQRFIERIYASYARSDYSPFERPGAVFAAPLAAAIAEDSRLNQGEVGYLDGDPLCQCQDAEGLKATVTSVRRPSRDQAIVSVSIRLHGYPPRPARFTLTRAGAGWRIADVWSAQEPSLLKALEAANRKARQKH